MTDPHELMRRRSPGWVRAMSSRELHQICGRLFRERLESDLSDRQEWLWDAIVSELAYRWRHPAEGERRCTCWLCFDEPDL